MLCCFQYFPMQKIITNKSKTEIFRYTFYSYYFWYSTHVLVRYAFIVRNINGQTSLLRGRVYYVKHFLFREFQFKTFHLLWRGVLNIFWCLFFFLGGVSNFMVVFSNTPSTSPLPVHILYDRSLIMETNSCFGDVTEPLMEWLKIPNLALRMPKAFSITCRAQDKW
jgi:hypothetical protein